MDVHSTLSAGATNGFGHATYYSYDVHGNVDHLVQDVPDLAAVSNQYKHLYYQYDLISGKVNQVDYSPGQRDEYHHRYTYDADNRIVQVETSKDAILWDKDANYQYYKHGPLSRAELGDLKVQGLDYAYTIQGWIKGVNSNTMSAVRDPGRDGDLSLGGNTHAKVATDAFGYTLGYFAGDYNPIGTFTTASKFEASTAGSDLLAARSDLWNGNISHMVTCLPKASDYAANQTITPEGFGSAYQYDQLNRLSSSRVFTNINTTTNQWQSGAGTNPSAYATDYTYDAMGNILTQKRNGGGTSATALDDLTYNYHTTTDGLVSNRLYHVNDVVSAGNYTDDIDDQGTFNNTHSTIETANNYGYDELGSLVRDAQEEIASIEWTIYGKMKKITRNSSSSKADLEFGYDASGNRLWKKVTPKGSGAVTSTYYYLRDAQGNEMCRYVKYTNTNSQLMYVAQEHSIYGSSRVGVDNRKDTLYMGAAYTPTWGGVGTSRRDLGSKSFELANHLGNVLVTVSDKPVYKVSSGTIYFQPEVSSISDYYPFGAPIQGRSAAFGGEYRFGFNGKENDGEVNGEGNSYAFEYRIHDARLGRWLALDPLAEKFPYISAYASFNNNSIYFIDLRGGENIPALTWARQNMANKGILSDYDRPWFGPTDNRWRFTSGEVPTRVVCYESCFIAYMNSGGNITPLLKSTGFSTKSGGFVGRSTPKGGENWFKAGDGTDRSFVTDILKGELGDIVFMGESADMEGHAVLLSELPVTGSYKNSAGSIIETLTLKTLSTSSTSEQNNYGEKSFTFEKQKNGSWKLPGLDGYKFRGYGQMNEDNMKGDPSLYPKKEAAPAEIE
jgi:RHS repeat-associated protein